MAINEDYLVRSLIEIKERVAALSEKIDETGVQLEENKAQTEALELEIREFREFVVNTKFFTKIILGLGSAVIALGGIVLGILRFFKS